ncbi:amidohydrolase [Corynebacterium sp. YSMAA1_1_D6]|uniref:amidohydrolase n=1 Tax=Corynebacterium sp. YSMAA1_1_D6 TaxID=3383589 RepID=UPI0038D1B4B1
MITLIDNAHILTQDPDHPVASAVACANGRVLALDQAARSLPAGETWDAGGRTLTPGFNDAHAHSVWFGQTLLDVSLDRATTPDDVYGALSAAESNPDGWIVAAGFRPSGLDAPVDIAALDRATNGKPLLIKHNSGHAYTVNTAALRAAGVDPADPPEVEGGEFLTDDNGCTGVLDENAMRYIQKVTLPESGTEIGRALEKATRQYLEWGLTSVTDAGVAGGWIGHSPREIAAYQDATLHTRMQVMVTMDVLHAVAGHAADGPGWGLDGGIRTGFGDEWLQLGPVKIFSDGSLLGTTAALTEDYACCAHHGYFQGDPSQMRSRALDAAASGWSLAIHAIGDAAVDFAIETLEEATARYGAPSMPHRIEHGGVVRPDQIERLRGQPIVVVPQPLFISAFGDAMAEALGPQRAALSYPGKRLLDASLVLPGSSDQPVAPGRPLDVMQAFVERRTASGELYGPQDRLTPAEALYAYTAGSAAATGWAGRKGQVMPGQLADFALLSHDPLTTAFTDISVDATIVGGELRYGTI